MKIIRTDYINAIASLDRFSATDLLAPIPKLEEIPKVVWTPAWVATIDAKLDQILELLRPPPLVTTKAFVAPKDKPSLDLAGAIYVYQRSALFDHGYSINHHCALCPHQEVSETFSKNIKDYLKRFPSELE